MNLQDKFSHCNALAKLMPMHALLPAGGGAHCCGAARAQCGTDGWRFAAANTKNTPVGLLSCRMQPYTDVQLFFLIDSSGVWAMAHELSTCQGSRVPPCDLQLMVLLLSVIICGSGSGFASSYPSHPLSESQCALADLASALVALSTYGGGVRKLVGKIVHSEKLLGASQIINTGPGGNQQPECGARGECRTLSEASTPIEEMELHVGRMIFTIDDDWATCLDTEELLSAISLCRSLRALRLKSGGLIQSSLEALQPLRDLAMLSRIDLDFAESFAPDVQWSLAALLQLLPVGQVISLCGPALAFDLPALSQPHPLQDFYHRAGYWSDYPKLVLPPRELGEAGWEVLKGLKTLNVDLDGDGLQQVCDGLSALESLRVKIDSPQSLECISCMSCLTRLSLAYDNDRITGDLSALTRLKGCCCTAALTKALQAYPLRRNSQSCRCGLLSLGLMFL